MTTEFAIKIEHLTKQFGKTLAVDDLSLEVPRGSTLGLLGPNGAGKSTTLRMLMGMLRPSSGSIRVLGCATADISPSIKQRVGYVPDANYIYRWMTVAKAIKFSRSMYETWNDDLCAELLDTFELPARRRVGALSKGMLAKLSLLIAMTHEPDLLVLDEPLSGLDPIARDDFVDGVMRGVCNGKQTVLFSSHQLDEVNRLADTVAIVNRGRLLIHRPLDELLSSIRRVRAVLHDGRLPNTPPPGTIWQRVNRREWLVTIRDFSNEILEQLRAENPIESLDVSELTLDDVFRDFIRGDKVDNTIAGGERTQQEPAPC